jgi:hypothetical protein
MAKRILNDEERERVEQLVDAMQAFKEEYGRDPNPRSEEFRRYWQSYVEAELRKYIECIERMGVRVVEENGEYKILNKDYLSRN